MKQAITILALLLSLVPNLKAQTFTFVLQSPQPGFTHYSSSGFISYRAHRPHNKKIITGAILAGSGGVLAGSGILVYGLLGFGPDREHGQMNYPMQDLGIGLATTGVTLAIIGAVLGRMGHNEKKRIYGWQLVAPKNNELGLAFNF